MTNMNWGRFKNKPDYMAETIKPQDHVYNVLDAKPKREITLKPIQTKEEEEIIDTIHSILDK